MIAFRLLSAVSLSHVRSEKLKLLLTVIGMALGIAIYCAIRSANENAVEAFASSAKLLSADFPLEIASPSGSVTEDIIPKILAVPGVSSIAPRSRYFARASSGGRELGTIQLLGADLFRPAGRASPDKQPEQSLEVFQDKRAIIVSPALSELITGGKLTLIVNSKPTGLKVVGTMPSSGLAAAFGGKTALIDIANFQDLIDVHGKIDALGIELDGSVPTERVRAEVSRLLPPQIQFQSVGDSTRHAQKMSEAFRLNLNFLSCISLFVAVLLIYNTVSYLILRRRRELSILRSLGASARDLFWMLTCESLLLGAAASIIGVVLGSALAHITVKLVSNTFSTLYLPVSVAQVQLSPSLIIQCLFLGPVLSFLGSVAPALEVYFLPPREAASYQQSETQFHSRSWIFSLLAAVCLAGSVAAANPRLLERSLAMGLVSPTLLILAAAFGTPVLLRQFIRTFGAILRRFFGIEAALALDHISTTLRRSSVAVAAMLVSLGMCAGLSTMILSFRLTVEHWIEHVTTADLYVSAAGSFGAGSDTYLPDQIVQYLTSTPLADFDYVSSKKVLLGDREVKVNGIRFESALRHNRFLFQKNIPLEPLSADLATGAAGFVSETFAQRYKIKPGDEIELPGLHETLRTKVANIFYDYSSDQGVVLIDHRAFEKLFEESRKEGVSLYLKSAADETRIRSELTTRFPDAALIVRSNRSLREEVLRVFDDTFKITYALQGIALLIAGLSVLNTVLMLMLERNREFAVMRAIGASKTSLTKMVVIEALLLGAASVAGALVLGSGLAVLLVFVINKFFFGWSVAFAVPYRVFFQMTLGTLLIAGAAGYFPGRKVAQSMEGSELRYE